MTQILIPHEDSRHTVRPLCSWSFNASITVSAKVAPISSLRSNPRFRFPISSTPAMSEIGLKYVKVDDAEACRRLRDNDASLIALQFVKIIFWKLIARLYEVDMKDAAAFVEGMRHNTHLQGLKYVP
jgi:hypothetical protein